MEQINLNICDNNNAGIYKEQATSSLPCLWVPEELQKLIVHLSKHFHLYFASEVR